MGVTLWVRLCGLYSRGFFNCLNRLGNAQLAVIRSIEVAVLQGFTYNGSLPKFNRDQGCWPLYRRWPLLRGDRYEGFCHRNFGPGNFGPGDQNFQWKIFFGKNGPPLENWSE